MRILQYGKMDRYNCEKCGCRFEAGRSESRRDEHGRRVCWCPCCGTTVESEEKPEMTPETGED